MSEPTSRIRYFPTADDARRWLEERHWRRIAVQPETWEPPGGGPGAVLDAATPATLAFRVAPPDET